jgi:F-type H+-transporting ATPase subunit O
MKRAATLLLRVQRTQGCSPALRCTAGEAQQLSFATQAPPAPTRDNFVEPPIAVFGTPGRYASALYSAASKAKSLPTAQKELAEVQKLAQDSADFGRFIKDPTISREQKATALESISSQMKLSELTSRFIGVLAQNDRLGELPAIADTFDDIMAAVRGEVKATVTTAEPLEPSQVDELKSSLGGVLKKGEKLFLEQKVDPSLIGGFVIDIGDKHMDMSIIDRVKKVQQLILESSD